MPPPEHRQNQERAIRTMRWVLWGAGAVFAGAGIIRQWPLLGKTYMEFIQGSGYLSLILGLILFACSIRLFFGEDGENRSL